MENTTTKASLFVVGIGASAGGLEALCPLVANLSCNANIAYVIAQHLSPQHRSMMVELLSRETELTVTEARNGIIAEPNFIYITPPNNDIYIKNRHLCLRHPQAEIGPKPSINYFFTSLANDCQEYAIGVLLSGTGSDGAHGMRAIKAAGGIAIAQKPDSAKYDSMPMAAIQLGAVDLELTPEEIARQLPAIINTPKPLSTNTAEPETGAELKTVIERIYQHQKLDFSRYKEATLIRQLDRRLLALQIQTLADYIAYIDRQPQELEQLVKNFLISVTSFFRDQVYFNSLREVLRRIIATKKPGNKIRVWVPGCATGEEPYSIAILLAEELAANLRVFDVKVFGTDLDANVIEQARRGLYPETSIEEIEQTLLKKYFNEQERHYHIKKFIRELVVFARQDLTQDPPFLNIDLISCRNVLIYFNTDLQNRVLSIFHYALLESGYLFLGKSESIGHNSHLFATYDTRYKIFQKKTGTPPFFLFFSSTLHKPRYREISKPPTLHKLNFDAFREKLLQSYIPASVLINQDNMCLHFFGNCTPYLKLQDRTANFDLVSLIIPELQTDLRALLRRVKNDVSDISGYPKKLEIQEQKYTVRIVIRTMRLDETDEEAFLVSFEELPAADHASLPESRRYADSDGEHRVAELEHELNSTRENLQTVIEELETSNEELQSLNEELQASAEELQASNEELETTNKELQATNEELTTVNGELKIKSAELTRINSNLENIQTSIDMGLVVVDSELKVILFTPGAVKIFGILPVDIGMVITSLPAHFHIPDLQNKIIRVIQNGDTIIEELETANISYLMRISPYLDELSTHHGAILTFNDVTALRAAHTALYESEQRFRNLVEGSLQGILIHQDFKPVFANKAAADIFGYRTIEQLLAVDSIASCYAEYEFSRMQDYYQARLYGKLAPAAYEVEAKRTDGTSFTLLQLVRLVDWNGGTAAQLTLVDITERKRAELKLKRSEALFHTIFSTSGAGIGLIRTDGRIMMTNHALYSMLGYDADEMQDKHFSTLTHPDDIETDQKLFNECIHGQRRSYTMEKRYLTKTGRMLWAELAITYNCAETEADSFFIAVVTDITERKQHEQAIAYQANYDALTDLPNRGLFMDRLSQHIKHSTRDDSSVYVLFIDLDGFKDINDTLGHDAGDELLQQVAVRLKKCVRETDTVARFGGDEFAVMLAGDIEIYAVERVIASILDLLHQPFNLYQGVHRVSASIGVAVYPTDAHNASTLLQYADTAMYRAKENKRDSVVFFQANMNDQVVERARMKQKIFDGIENNEFILHYQPIVELGNGRIIGAEALLRWQHPSEGLIMPGKFISISEETGQIVLIGKWVLEQAIRQLIEWRETFGRDFYISVNLSPRQLYEDSLLEFIAGLPDEILRQLVFEITESIFLDTHQIAVKTLELIQAKGGKISIDDFGTGYSSLTYLRSFPVNTVKIDQSFIRQENTITAPNDAFIEAILALAQGIGAKVVAEGIETSEQLEFLRMRTCQLGQGFYFAKPMQQRDFENFMQNWK